MTTPISATDIGERIRQALDGTTPGPWRAIQIGVRFDIRAEPGVGYDYRGQAVSTAGDSEFGSVGAADAALLAAAPQLLTEALAVIEAQERTIADLTAERDQRKDQYVDGWRNLSGPCPTCDGGNLIGVAACATCHGVGRVGPTS